MPSSKKKRPESAKTSAAAKQKAPETTFSSLEDFEEKMFPRAVAGRSLRYGRNASRTFGERLGDALAQRLAGRLESS